MRLPAAAEAQSAQQAEQVGLRASAAVGNRRALVDCRKKMKEVELALATLLPGFGDTSGNDAALPSLMPSTTDVYAALSSFVEKNKPPPADENTLAAALLSVSNRERRRS